MARMELFRVNNSSIKVQSEIIFWMNENLLTHEGEMIDYLLAVKWPCQKQHSGTS